MANVIDIKTRRANDAGLQGVHEAHDGKGKRLSWDDSTGKFSAKPGYNKEGGYNEASITLFEDTIQNHLPTNRAVFNDPGMTKDEGLVSTFAHEAEHDLNKRDIAEIKGRYEKKGTHYDVDDFNSSAAYKMSKQVYKEIH